MHEPKAWKMLGEQLHQDFILIYEDFETGLTSLFEQFDERERAEIAEYLEYLRQPCITDEQRFSAWAATGAAFLPASSQIAKFIDQVYILLKEGR